MNASELARANLVGTALALAEAIEKGWVAVTPIGLHEVATTYGNSLVAAAKGYRLHTGMHLPPSFGASVAKSGKE